MSTSGNFELTFAANGNKIWKRDGMRVKATAVPKTIRTQLEGAPGKVSPKKSPKVSPKKTSVGRGKKASTKRSPKKSPPKTAKSPPRAASPKKSSKSPGRKSPAKSPHSPQFGSIAEAQSNFSEALERKRFKKRHWKRNLIRIAEEIDQLAKQVDEASALQAKKAASMAERNRANDILAFVARSVYDLNKRLRPVVEGQRRKGL